MPEPETPNAGEVVMGWKSVVWAGCLAPVLAGCGALRQAAPGDAERSPTRFTIARDQRRDARAAWQAVRDRNPGHAFTDEFRDGFLDGYSDYLERGEAAQPPAVPPSRYAQNAAGAVPVREYYLGFQYAADVAVASGRQSFSVPVQPAQTRWTTPNVPYVPPPPSRPAPQPTADTGPNKFDTAAPAPDRWAPAGSGEPAAPLPKPELPVIKPFNPPRAGDAGSKFTPHPVPPNPEPLSVPPATGPVPQPAPVPPTTGPVPQPTPVLPPTAQLPGPSPAVPVPATSAPSIFDDIPVIPFQFPLAPQK